MLRVGELSAARHGFAADHFAFFIGEHNHLNGMAESLSGFVEGGHHFNARKHAQRAVVASPSGYGIDVGAGRQCGYGLGAFVTTDDVASGINAHGHPGCLHGLHYPLSGRQVFSAISGASDSAVRELTNGGESIQSLLEAIAVNSH